MNASDPDGDTLTYTLLTSDGVSRNFFWLNPTDGSVMLQRALTTVSTNRFVVSHITPILKEYNIPSLFALVALAV